MKRYAGLSCSNETCDRAAWAKGKCKRCYMREYERKHANRRHRKKKNNGMSVQPHIGAIFTDGCDVLRGAYDADGFFKPVLLFSKATEGEAEQAARVMLRAA